MVRLIALIGPVVVLVDQAVDSVGWERILNYGVLGIFTVALAFGKLESPRRADRAEEALAAERASKSELEAVFRKDVVPALTRFTDVASQLLARAQS